jgi:hypothetical protein
MKHFNHTSTNRLGRTTADWLPIGAQISKVANEWSGRTDLVAFIGEGATEGLAVALFKPEIAEIELNVERAFGFGVTPAHIGDFTERSSRYEFPRATGAILHEALHARFSRWDIIQAHKDLEADEAKALVLLEESRIEAQGLQLDPNYRLFLRSSALELAIGELETESLTNLTAQLAGQLVGLVQARVVAGVLEEDEVKEIITIVRTNLGEEVFDRLSEIAHQYQQHKNHWNIESSYPLAKEWAKLLRDLAEERGEEQSEQGESGEGSGTPSGESGKEMSKELSELFSKIEEAASEVSISTDLDLYDQERAEDWAEEVEQRNSASKERAEHGEVSDEVFGRGTGEVACGGTFSVLANSRPATSAERVAAVTVARMLEKAKYRERDITEVTSRVPQGRLNTRAAIQNAAQKAQGQLPTADEWSRRVRKHTDEPTLNVGVMVDISGSMRPAMEAMATTAWVMSEAVRRVQGKAAMVYYGQDVFATLKAGQHLDGVKVWTANDPTEQFDKAFKALDGSLNLLHGKGARLLVVVSDGVYTDREQRNAERIMKRCNDSGVAVLWLTYQPEHNSYATRLCRGTKAVVLQGRLDPTDAALLIGKSCAKALETAMQAA